MQVLEKPNIGYCRLTFRKKSSIEWKWLFTIKYVIDGIIEKCKIKLG